MDDKQVHFIAALRSCLFFLFLFSAVDVLAYFKIYLLFFDGLVPVFYLALFFPAWEFFYFADTIRNKRAFFFWSFGFFCLVGALFDPIFAFIFLYVFFLILYLETNLPKSQRIFFLCGFIVGVFASFFWLLFFPLSFFIVTSKIKNHI